MGKPFNEINKRAQEEQQKEAERRAAVIEAVVKEVLDSATRHEITINDLKVVIDTIIRQAEGAFISRKVSEFIEL